MPEIAEIALTSEILDAHCKGKKITKFEFVSGRYHTKQPASFDEFSADLPLQIVSVNAKGKFMWFELSTGKPSEASESWYIYNTFGLTGIWSFTEVAHTRAKITLSDKSSVYFADMRNFGTFKFSTDKAELEKKLDTLSPDFLREDFNLNTLTKYNIPIVKILMDQKKVGSGLGNYLTAEILYRAKLSPYRTGRSLSQEEIENLVYWIKYVVKLSYINNHTGYMEYLKNDLDKITKHNYHPEIQLADPTFHFKVYRRTTDEAGNPVVGAKIVGTGDNKRTTYWVPAVQK